MSMLSGPMPWDRTDGDKLPGGVAEFQVGQILRNHVDPAGVSDHDDGIGQLFRPDVDMERGTVRVDDQFRFGNSHDYAVCKKQI